MTTQNLIKQQTCWTEFLSRFNFVIFYTPNRENRKADSITHQSDDCSANNQDNLQQHLLQTIFLLEKLKISTINLDKNKTTFEKEIQENLIDLYGTKLRKKIRTSSFIKNINTCHFSNVFIDIKDCIH